MNKRFYLLIATFFLAVNLSGQDSTAYKLLDLKKFRVKGYGVLNYYSLNYDTDINIKNKIDAERLVFYLNYNFTPTIELKSEIEFEHGGTGATMELDTQEEFGEYEQEIESGGEAKVEQLNINFKLDPRLNVRVGKFKVYFGLAQNLDEPTEYFTAHRQEMQNAILPLGWYETGVDLHGNLLNDRLSYHLAVFNGLDATGFSSRNFIKAGYQTRFEMVQAESFAGLLRLDYNFKSSDSYVGIAGYIGNTSQNRPKNDMDDDAYLSMGEMHVKYEQNNLRFNGMVLYGHLQNSDLITQLNSNVSNNLGVKRTPVAKAALGAEFEIGYNIMNWIKPGSRQKLFPFARVDYYDTMYETRGDVVDKPRWERLAWTGGFNYFVHPDIVFKAHYQDRKLGSEHIDPFTLEKNGKNQHEKTFTAGIGFNF